MNFDEIINRIGTHSSKWDTMEERYGVAPKDGISMWVADMDFRPPQCVADVIAKMHHHGVYGYYGNDGDYRSAICWWMEKRHHWSVNPSDIFTTHGLVHGTAMCIETFTGPGDGVILFTPAYHEFTRVIREANRQVVECPLKINQGRYEMDFDTYDEILTGREKMLVLCSPQNPGGTVWRLEELQAVAEFAKKHDLVIVSDEIHHDLVMPGQKHTIMASIEGIADRLVMMSAPTKTFNIAGCHTGQVIIADQELRRKFSQRMGALGLSGNSFGLFMTEAAYSPAGALWVDALMQYLEKNARIFDEGIHAIRGLSSMKLEATYLAWVDFSQTGLPMPDIINKIEKDAKIAANHGKTFGTGGETFMRFNLGLPTSRLVDAIERLQHIFDT